MLRFALIKDLSNEKNERQTPDDAENLLITEVDSVRSGMDCQVQLDGEGERGTAGGNRTGEGVLKVSLESQFNKFDDGTTI